MTAVRLLARNLLLARMVSTTQGVKAWRRQLFSFAGWRGLCRLCRDLFRCCPQLFHGATPRLRPTLLVGRQMDTSFEVFRSPVSQIAGLRLSEMSSAWPRMELPRVKARASRPTTRVERSDQQILQRPLETTAFWTISSDETSKAQRG